jgi:hypothetical protein
MSSSSRSIAAARQKRAGEQSQQPMNNSKPVTSISSQAAFAQQQQYQQQKLGQTIPVGSKNVRAAQNKSQQNISNNSSGNSNQTKMTVSNAIGLVTLRLGRLEQIIRELHEEGGMNFNTGENSIPSNMKMVSDEVFDNIVNRMNLLESKLLNSKNTDNLLAKLDKDVNDMKGIVENVHNSLFNFISETNEKFTDVENALALIEENTQLCIESSNEMIEMNENNENNESNELNQFTENCEGNENVILNYNETNEANESKNEINNESNNE